MSSKNWFIMFFKDFIYLFLERGREGEREGEKHRSVVASCTPHTGDLACNPGMWRRLGIEPATLWFTGRHSIHWVTPAMAKIDFFKAHKEFILTKASNILKYQTVLSNPIPEELHKYDWMNGWQIFQKTWFLVLRCTVQKKFWINTVESH